MGLYKENYECKKLGLTLPKAYAIITDFKLKETDGKTYGRAIFAVQTSREACTTKEPIETVILNEIELDRSKNVLTQCYDKMKEGETFETINPETNEKETITNGMPFYGWSDDV